MMWYWIHITPKSENTRKYDLNAQRLMLMQFFAPRFIPMNLVLCKSIYSAQIFISIMLRYKILIMNKLLSLRPLLVLRKFHRMPEHPQEILFGFWHTFYCACIHRKGSKKGMKNICFTKKMTIRLLILVESSISFFMTVLQLY